MPKIIKVQDGDCMASIAYGTGFMWETLWNHPDNADLKAKRQDPNVLYKGDIVHIPDLRLRVEDKPVDNQHQFKVKKSPAKLRIQFLKQEPKPKPVEEASGSDPSVYQDPDFEPENEPEKPRANEPYILEIDGDRTNGSTDGNGVVEVKIKPNARSGKIIFNAGTPKEEVYPLGLGKLDPIEELEGVRKRLNNLGYFCGEGPDTSPQFQGALVHFQEDNGLELTGKLDDDTRNKLKDVHGS